MKKVRKASLHKPHAILSVASHRLRSRLIALRAMPTLYEPIPVINLLSTARDANLSALGTTWPQMLWQLPVRSIWSLGFLGEFFCQHA